jgi:hypothetical protein
VRPSCPVQFGPRPVGFQFVSVGRRLIAHPNLRVSRPLSLPRMPGCPHPRMLLIRLTDKRDLHPRSGGGAGRRGPRSRRRTRALAVDLARYGATSAQRTHMPLSGLVRYPPQEPPTSHQQGSYRASGPRKECVPHRRSTNRLHKSVLPPRLLPALDQTRSRTTPHWPRDPWRQR